MVPCPRCKQQVKIYGQEYERHKVYVYDKKGRKTNRWSYCPQRKVQGR